MERIYIKNLEKNIGKEVKIAGWIDVRRDHGKLIFLDLRDRTGLVQMVVLPNHNEAKKAAENLKPESVVEIMGIINERPQKMVNPELKTGKIEVEVVSINILSEAEELPFEKDTVLNLDTYLNYLPLTLRGNKRKAIFSIQTGIIQSFRQFLKLEEFTEIQVPKIVGEDAEGGATSFELEYFGQKAYLAQSPQFYKQIMVGVFEKVFTTTSVYRAEKHSTTRHLNEYTSLDLEFGFIRDHQDIMDLENKLLIFICQELKNNYADEIKLLGSNIPEVPNKIPTMKLKEAQELIKKETGDDCTDKMDLEPQHERWLGDYAKNKLNSEFIFITHYPVEKRPMYTYEDEDDRGYTKSFDLLFRGVEITTGGQRIHNYNDLVLAIEKKGLNPKNFSFYLQAFKFAMPPHGGLGMGLERLTAQLLGLENIKEATLFPRDMNRIDNLLSK